MQESDSLFQNVSKARRNLFNCFSAPRDQLIAGKIFEHNQQIIHFTGAKSIIE